MRVALTAVVLAGCASARTGNEQVDASQGVDAKVWLDAPAQMPDARPDAQPVTPTDAPTPPDAYQCQVMTRQLLTNPVFDLTPIGMGWVQQNIDNNYPIITGDGNGTTLGLAEHSAPYDAWMGGIVGSPTATDVLYQDVTVPANTTQLRFTATYEVRTGETGSSVYDTGQVALTQTNGTPIETIRSLSNTTPTTAWTAINYTVVANLSNQTVRLRFTSSNDFSNETSFYFDTLALTATYCQ